MSFNYLKEIREIYKNPSNLKEIVFIIGGKSCDMDSALSAYLLSLGKNLKENIISIDKTNNTPTINKDTTKIYLPVLNCGWGFLSLRLDIKFVFEKFGIDEKSFWYTSDEIFKKSNLFKYPKNDNIKTSIILVDLNNLEESQQYLSDYVLEIYDHHAIKKFDYKNLKKIAIKAPIGSCTTLILLEYFMVDFPSCLISPDFALSAVLLDTENFKPSLYGNRWIDIDKIVFDKIKSNDESISMDEYYKNINGAKFDEKKNLELGIKNLLLKDQKTYDWGEIKVTWSAFTIPYFKIQNAYGDKELLNNYLNYYKSCKTPDDARTIFYFTNSDLGDDKKIFTIFNPVDIPIEINVLQEEIEQRFKKKNIPIIDAKIQGTDKEGVTYFITLDKTASRKLLEPIFREIFTSPEVKRKPIKEPKEKCSIF